MQTLRAKAFIQPILKHIKQKSCFWGFILGMQLLFEMNYENSKHEGLGLIEGEVVKFSLKIKISQSRMEQN